MKVIQNPAFWASIAALLAGLGIVVPELLFDHLVAIGAAITGIIGILTSFGEAGHRLEYKPPDNQP